MTSTSRIQEKHLNDLPRVLMDIVVKDMDSDTLKTCTLLSRPWRISASRKLFENVTVYTEDESLYHNGASHNVQNLQLESFSSFLASDASSNMASCIQYLEINGPATHNHCTESKRLLTVEDIDFLLVKLPRLKTLRLQYLHLTSCCSNATIECWRSPRNVDQLLIDGIHLPTPRTGRPESDSATVQDGNALSAWVPLVQLLNLFGAIDLFEVRNTTISFCPYHIVSVDSATPTPTLLDAVNIKGIFSFLGEYAPSKVLKTLHDLHGLTALQNLRMYTDSEDTREFLKAVGHSLTRFHLGMYLTSGRESAEDIYGISYCSRLDSLHITLLDDEDDFGAAVINIITHCPSTISQLTITADHTQDYQSLHSPCFLDSIPLNTLDAVLSDRHPSVDVTFDCLHGDDGDDVDEYEEWQSVWDEEAGLVKKKMPLLQARNRMYLSDTQVGTSMW